MKTAEAMAIRAIKANRNILAIIATLRRDGRVAIYQPRRTSVHQASFRNSSRSFATLEFHNQRTSIPLASCCFYSGVNRHCWNLRNSSSRSSAVNLCWRGEASARCPGNRTTLSARWFAAPWLSGPGLVRCCVHELAWARAAMRQLMRFS